MTLDQKIQMWIGIATIGAVIAGPILIRRRSHKWHPQWQRLLGQTQTRMARTDRHGDTGAASRVSPRR